MKESTPVEEPLTDAETNEQVPIPAGSKTINDLYTDNKLSQGKENGVKHVGPMVARPIENTSLPEFELIEKEEPAEEQPQPAVEKEIVSDILHQHDFPIEEELPPVVKKRGA